MKLKYKMPVRRILWHRRRTIVTVLAAAVALRVGYAYLAEPGPVEINGLRHLARAFTPDKSNLPVYNLCANKRNLDKLSYPGGDDRVKSWSYADVILRYEDPSQDERQCGRAKARVRGFNFVPSDVKKNLKIRLKDMDIDGMTGMALLSDELKLGLSHWYPWHMWLASELGLKVPRTRFVRVKMNGEDWGLYVEVEPWGDSLLGRYGLRNAEIFGEDDYYPYNVDYYLYDNIARWKKYETEGVDMDDFSHLDQWLTFLRDSDDTTFRRHVFSFVDKDNIVAWHVHMALMDSYHQNSARNARMLYNSETGLFEFMPWDALPGILNTIKMHNYETYVVSRLSLRLKSHPEFMAAYCRGLYQAICEHLPNLETKYMAMYTNDDVTYAVRKDQRRTKSRFFNLNLKFTIIDYGVLRGLENMFCSWRHTCRYRRNRLVRTWVRRKAILESAIVFAIVDRHPRAKRGGVRDWKVAIGYDAQAPSTIEGIRLPIINWRTVEAMEAPVTLSLTAKPHSKHVYQPLFPRDRVPEPVTFRATGRISNGYLVLDDCDLTLMPGYPKLEKLMIRTNKPVRCAGEGEFTDALETQEYVLNISLPTRLEPSMSKLELRVRNRATEGLATVNRKVINSIDYDQRLRRAADPKDTAGAYAWLDYDDEQGVLRVGTDQVLLNSRLIVPKGTRLVVPAGTVFQMGPRASIISFSPLEMNGTSDRPIVFAPVDPHARWGVIAVLDSPEPSVLRHVRICGAGTDRIMGMSLDGALCFRRSQSVQEDCLIDEQQADRFAAIR